MDSWQYLFVLAACLAITAPLEILGTGVYRHAWRTAGAVLPVAAAFVLWDAVAIAAHELGHAMQDAEEYFPMKVRSALVPVVNIGSNLGWFLIIIGLVLNIIQLAWIGVFVFAGGALFALATLPVEFNASARAKELLAQTGIIQTAEERHGVNQVLNAAALT